MRITGYQHRGLTHIAARADDGLIPLGPVEEFWGDPYAAVAAASSLTERLDEDDIARPTRQAERSHPVRGAELQRTRQRRTLRGTRVPDAVRSMDLVAVGSRNSCRRARRRGWPGLGGRVPRSGWQAAAHGRRRAGPRGCVRLRGVQRHHGPARAKLTTQWTLGKNVDGSGAMSDLVTRDEVGDVYGRKVVARVNGEVMQHASTDQMIFRRRTHPVVHQPHADAPRPGDLVATGTPSGGRIRTYPQAAPAPGTRSRSRSRGSVPSPPGSSIATRSGEGDGHAHHQDRRGTVVRARRARRGQRCASKATTPPRPKPSRSSCPTTCPVATPRKPPSRQKRSTSWLQAGVLHQRGTTGEAGSDGLGALHHRHCPFGEERERRTGRHARDPSQVVTGDGLVHSPRNRPIEGDFNATATTFAAMALFDNLDAQQQARIVVPLDNPVPHQLELPPRVRPTGSPHPRHDRSAALPRAPAARTETVGHGVRQGSAGDVAQGARRLSAGWNVDAFGHMAAHFRDPEGYFLTLFNQPQPDSHWGWRLVGHHLSLNFTIIGQDRMAVTPLLFGAEPGRLGPYRILGEEEDRAFALLSSLEPTQVDAATIHSVPPPDFATRCVPFIVRGVARRAWRWTS